MSALPSDNYYIIVMLVIDQSEQLSVSKRSEVLVHVTVDLPTDTQMGLVDTGIDIFILCPM